MNKCRSVTLSGKRCSQRVAYEDSSEYCYYHKKLKEGLTNPAEAIGVIYEES